MSFGRRSGLVFLVAALLLGTVAPALAQSPQVAQSLWGVRGDVGLGVVPQFVTNYGDRAFYEERPSGEDVRVAVIDTGLDPGHPDLDGSLACVHCWRDFVDNRTQPYDDNGHGTHVAGIIAGNGHLQANPLNRYFPTGAIGLASDTGLIVAKAMNESGQADDERVAESIRWAMDPDDRPDSGDEPHILHLSLGVTSGGQDGSPRTGSETEQAVREAVERGIPVVMSAGNQAEQGPAIPGNVEGVIAVGALTSNGDLLPSSNRGAGVDVFAPGVIMSTWPGSLDGGQIQDGYKGEAGTSQAAPIVTGGLALAVDANPQLEEGDAAKVTHLESMVRQTSETRTASGSQLQVFDGSAFLASQDQGTEDLHWGMIAALALLLVLVGLALGRLGLAALRAREEAERDLPPMGSEQGESPEPDQPGTRSSEARR